MITKIARVFWNSPDTFRWGFLGGGVLCANVRMDTNTMITPARYDSAVSTLSNVESSFIRKFE